VSAVPQQQPAANGLGIIDFIFGLLSLLTRVPGFGILPAPVPVVGLVLSWLGYFPATKGQATNSGLALAGLILSGVGLLPLVAFLALVAFVFRARPV
jgi:hypothetical protein